MRVFAHPTGIYSPAMLRVASALARYAPPEIEVVAREADADVVVSHVFESPFSPAKPEIVIQYCFGGLSTALEVWMARWRRALTVWSYYDLPYLTQQNGFPFYHAPLGVDRVFTEPFEDRERDLDIMTSGFVTGPDAEAIEEVAMVAWMLNLQHVHLGPPKVDGMKVQIDLRSINGVNDRKLASYYQRCKWVSGLRHVEGFELPALEGLCCGARPIVFDRPEMRQWYNGHAVFIPECSGTELVKYLLDVLADDPEPVTRDEREWAAERFDWKPIVENLWKRVL